MVTADNQDGGAAAHNITSEGNMRIPRWTNSQIAYMKWVIETAPATDYWRDRLHETISKHMHKTAEQWAEIEPRQGRVTWWDEEYKVLTVALCDVGLGDRHKFLARHMADGLARTTFNWREKELFRAMLPRMNYHVGKRTFEDTMGVD